MALVRTPWLAALISVCACGRGRFDELRSDGSNVDAYVAASGLAITATANLFGAGHAVPPAPGGNGAGVLPPGITLPAGSNRVLTVTDVAGMIDYGLGPMPADGLQGTLLSTATSYGGLVDVTCQRYNVLAAVFLDDREPDDPAPPSLTVDATAASFTGIMLRQFFFVGDGLTGAGSGVSQTFAIPDAATRLYFGFADASGDGQPPGSYSDNSGLLTATVRIGGS